jgi:hypothetical protein
MKSPLSSSRTRHAYRFTLTTLFLCTCLIGLAHPGWSQTPNGHEPRGILGYLNPRTGAFTTRIHSASGVEPEAAPTPTYGELVFNIQISIWSTLPADAVLSCSGEATISDGGNFHLETASVDTTRNGNKASCQVIIPYYWLLSSPNIDQIDLSFSVSTKASDTRDSSHSAGSIPVPVNGIVTSKAFVTRF